MTTIAGVGLHTGVRVSVRLLSEPGPIRLARSDPDGAVREAPLTRLAVVGTQRSTEVGALADGLRVRTVEHLFAALAGLGVREGLKIVVDGPELPLLDGGAATWCAALAALGLAAAPPRLRVARDAILDVEGSRYEFQTADRVEVACRLEVDDVRVAPDAAWAGAPDDFQTRIAPARTFAFEHEIADFARAGLAKHVDAAAVVVFSPGAVHSVGPWAADEPARHKLLDLVGDAYLYGGPPLGRLSAVRPGHAANARAFRRAMADGILVGIS